MSVDYVSLIAILGPMAAILSAFAAIAIALLAYRQLKLNRHEMETTFRAWMGMAVPVEDTFLAGALLDDGSRIPPQLLRIPEKRASYASRIKSIMLRYPHTDTHTSYTHRHTQTQTHTHKHRHRHTHTDTHRHIHTHTHTDR